MAPIQSSQVLLSPAELSFIHSSLSLNPPIRPDGRTPTDFRPMIAESDILPGANGSARICFADGTEAIVGVKAEVEKSQWRPTVGEPADRLTVAAGDVNMDDDDVDNEGEGKGQNSWVEMSIELPGFRDDDPLPVFLSAMLTEALLASGNLKDRLYINRRFHWKLYIDILLLSPPLSYPLPLLSLTTHLALLSARLPALKSEKDEDPLFDDDWDASVPLYSRSYSKDSSRTSIDKPPITLLVMAVGSNVIFDPSKEELAVAEAVFGVSCATSQASPEGGIRLLSIRTIDPPSRLTPAGIPNSMNSAAGGHAPTSSTEAMAQREALDLSGVWTPPRGGIKRGLVAHIIKAVIEKGGVAEEVTAALENVDISR